MYSHWYSDGVVEWCTDTGGCGVPWVSPGEETGSVGVSDLMGVGEWEAEEPIEPTDVIDAICGGEKIENQRLIKYKCPVIVLNQFFGENK